VVGVVPPCRNGPLHGHTVLVLFVLEALVDLLKLFLACLQAVAGKPFVFGSIRWVLDSLRLEDGLFLLEGEGVEGEGFDDSAPLLADGHLMALQVLVSVAFPVEEGLLILGVFCEVDEFALEDDYSVLLVLGDLGDEGVDVLEHLGVEVRPQLLGSVGVDGGVDEVELLLEYAVRCLVGQGSGHYFHELVRGHLGVLDHLEEAPPDECAAEDVLDVVDVFDEELERHRVDDVLHEAVVLEVEQNGLVVVGAVVVGLHLGLRQHQHFDHVDLAVLLEESDLDLVQSEGGVLGGEAGLLDGDCGVGRVVLRVPQGLDEVEGSLLEPELPPGCEGELGDLEVGLHFCEEVIDGGVVPLVLMEVLGEGFAEVVLLHEVEQLLHGGCALGVGDAVEDGVCDGGVLDLAPDGVGGDHLVLVVPPALALQEGRHGGLVVDGLAVVLYLLQAVVRDEVGEALVEPEVVPPLHGDQVAEPVVRQFVRDGVGEGEQPVGGHLLLENVEVVEGHDGCVLHGAPLVLVREHLVVLVEGVGVAEEGLEEPHGLNGDFEDEGGQVLHVVVEGLDAVEGHGYFLSRVWVTLYCCSGSSLSSRYSPAMKQKR